MLRAAWPVSLLLDGSGGFAGSWRQGPLIALGPERFRRPTLEALDRLVAGRRAVGGAAETGVAALVAYDGAVTILTVDRSLRELEPSRYLFTVREGAEGEGAEQVATLRKWLDKPSAPAGRPPARSRAAARTSLPREAYLRAVRQVKRYIGRGELYQANLCQLFNAAWRDDPFELYLELAARTPAPHSAYVEAPGFALASLSPETFLRMSTLGRVETHPIKGTRPRGASPAEDAAAARSLSESEKDRAELLMIVDLERNDLSRVCRAGTVRVSELAALRSYASVHHLSACVTGRMRAGVGPAELLRATFPGGSITGAPKLRAIELLRALEPLPRGLYTGSLLWFGDDGTLDSSILIRSLVFGPERVCLGAGGGVVADSDPELEWRESNHKARPLAVALGFDPEEAR